MESSSQHRQYVPAPSQQGTGCRDQDNMRRLIIAQPVKEFSNTTPPLRLNSTKAEILEHEVKATIRSLIEDPRYHWDTEIPWVALIDGSTCSRQWTTEHRIEMIILVRTATLEASRRVSSFVGHEKWHGTPSVGNSTLPEQEHCWSVARISTTQRPERMNDPTTI